MNSVIIRTSKENMMKIRNISKELQISCTTILRKLIEMYYKQEPKEIKEKHGDYSIIVEVREKGNFTSKKYQKVVNNMSNKYIHTILNKI